MFSSTWENLVSVRLQDSLPHTLNSDIHQGPLITLQLGFFLVFFSSPKHNSPLFGKESIPFPFLPRERQMVSKGLYTSL